jgi:hypothetical protein
MMKLMVNERIGGKEKKQREKNYIVTANNKEEQGE